MCGECKDSASIFSSRFATFLCCSSRWGRWPGSSNSGPDTLFRQWPRQFEAGKRWDPYTLPGLLIAHE